MASRQAQIDKVRARIRQLREQIRALPSAPIPDDEIDASVRGYLRESAAASHRWANFCRAIVAGRPIDAASAPFAAPVRGSGTEARVDLAPLFGALYRAGALGSDGEAQLVAAVQRAAAAHVGDAPRIPQRHRGERLAELRAEQERLELEEERIVREAEAAGQPIARRPAAQLDPSILLGAVWPDDRAPGGDDDDDSTGDGGDGDAHAAGKPEGGDGVGDWLEHPDAR